MPKKTLIINYVSYILQIITVLVVFLSTEWVAVIIGLIKWNVSEKCVENAFCFRKFLMTDEY